MSSNIEKGIMNQINKSNSSLRKSQITTNRIEKLIPILEDCFRNCTWLDEYASYPDQIIEMIKDVRDNEQYHRMSIEFPDDCTD